MEDSYLVDVVLERCQIITSLVSSIFEITLPPLWPYLVGSLMLMRPIKLINEDISIESTSSACSLHVLDAYLCIRASLSRFPLTAKEIL